ncbi:MAG: type II toxin-antitoxin system HicB family antitoxin [Nitrospirae bacterium]|nr:type II toxin-antitoxin system HicB family antitoxin [Nitrospirota bacterium]
MKITLDEYMKLQYLTVVIPEECTDGSLCYRAEHPQLPGCMSHGRTPDEAIRNIIAIVMPLIEETVETKIHLPLKFDMSQSVSEAA